jgi:hypothetical protein
MNELPSAPGFPLYDLTLNAKSTMIDIQPTVSCGRAKVSCVEILTMLNKPPQNPHRSQFLFGVMLGEGSYAKVIHAKLKDDTSREFAIKIMDKYHIKKENKVRSLFILI